jgi:hypothetical protein
MEGGEPFVRIFSILQAWISSCRFLRSPFTWSSAQWYMKGVRVRAWLYLNSKWIFVSASFRFYFDTVLRWSYFLVNKHIRIALSTREKMSQGPKIWRLRADTGGYVWQNAFAVAAAIWMKQSPNRMWPTCILFLGSYRRCEHAIQLKTHARAQMKMSIGPLRMGFPQGPNDYQFRKCCYRLSSGNPCVM